MFQIRPFQIADILAIAPREPDKSIAQAIADFEETARIYQKNGRAFTGLVDETPIAAAGLVMIWPGVAAGWAFTSDAVRTYRLSFHRSVRRYLDLIAQDLKLHRVQVEIPSTHKVSRCWVKTLGFKREGVMRQYGTDRSDFVRYVKFYGTKTCPSFQS